MRMCKNAIKNRSLYIIRDDLHAVSKNTTSLSLSLSVMPSCGQQPVALSGNVVTWFRGRLDRFPVDRTAWFASILQQFRSSVAFNLFSEPIRYWPRFDMISIWLLTTRGTVLRRIYDALSIRSSWRTLAMRRSNLLASCWKFRLCEFQWYCSARSRKPKKKAGEGKRGMEASIGHDTPYKT